MVFLDVHLRAGQPILSEHRRVVKLQFRDFNGAEGLLAGVLRREWDTLRGTLAALPLHVKASDQEGKQGSLVFDPVATNAAVKAGLMAKKWATNILIPKDASFLGKDVDFFHKGLLVEAQFSNYPFFLNNVVRSALLAKSGALLDGSRVQTVVIITKARLFPSSNSTLYYEQAVSQLEAFARYGVFDVPIRVLGLFEDPGSRVPAVWRDSPGRYSRDLTNQKNVVCELSDQTRANSICKLSIVRR